jgi:calcium/calmodulin-dependent protein kinase I
MLKQNQGLSKIVGETAILHTACGTPAYVGKTLIHSQHVFLTTASLAPEVLKCQGYGQEVDMWAVGTVFLLFSIC